MKVKRKNDISKSSIRTSTNDIVTLALSESYILTESVKQTIDITYDTLGYSDIGLMDLGSQWDHRVTWLHFNLDNLIWNLQQTANRNKEQIYSHYSFKIAFNKNNYAEPNSTWIWEFDGKDFEIPREITKEAGIYSFNLIIEEFLGDEDEGNIIDKTKIIERFVTAPLKGKITKSIYNPIMKLNLLSSNTEQKKSLIKPTILGSLSDVGTLNINTDELGQQFDSGIRYIKFNPQKITAHLNDFKIFAVFTFKDQVYSSIFERTTPDDPFDDYSESYPVITWIPSEVYKTAGLWKMNIVAFLGNEKLINNWDISDDYYLYVSREVKIKVQANNLTEKDLEQEAPISVTTNIMTDAGELVLTKDNTIYQIKKNIGE